MTLGIPHVRTLGLHDVPSRHAPRSELRALLGSRFLQADLRSERFAN